MLGRASWALLLVACCTSASGARVVKRKESGCVWTHHRNTFSNGYAVGVDGQAILDRLYWNQAKARCRQVGNACQAITCSSPDRASRCWTLRAGAELRSETGTDTWVPKCHACHNLAGTYWTIGLDNNSDSNTIGTLTQWACGGRFTVVDGMWPLVANRPYTVVGNRINSWDANGNLLLRGNITPGQFANNISWSNGWRAMQCPNIEGVYEARRNGFAPSQLTLTQTGCAGLWAPESEPWQTTAFTLLPGLKIQTTDEGRNTRGTVSYDKGKGFFKIAWGAYKWQQLDESTTTLREWFR